MKIHPEHYEYMKTKLMTLAPQIQDYRDNIEAEGRARDPEMRLRWDLFYDSGLSRWACDVIYEYANDSHIDTALRAIMRELQP